MPTKPMSHVISWILVALLGLFVTQTATAQVVVVPSGGGVTVFSNKTQISGSSQFGTPGLWFSPVNRVVGNRNYFRTSSYSAVQIRARVYSLREMDEQLLRGAGGFGNGLSRSSRYDATRAWLQRYQTPTNECHGHARRWRQ